MKFNSEEYRQQQSASARRQWADPEMRKKMLRGQRSHTRTPEHAEALRASLSSPESRRRSSDSAPVTHTPTHRRNAAEAKVGGHNAWLRCTADGREFRSIRAACLHCFGDERMPLNDVYRRLKDGGVAEVEGHRFEVV